MTVQICEHDVAKEECIHCFTFARADLVATAPSAPLEADWGLLVKKQHYGQLLAIERASKSTLDWLVAYDMEFDLPEKHRQWIKFSITELRKALGYQK